MPLGSTVPVGLRGVVRRDERRLRAGGNVQRFAALQRRHLHGSTESQRREVDRQLTIEIIIFTLEERMLLHVNDDVEIAGRAAVHAGFNWQFTKNLVVGVEADGQWMKPRYAFCRETDRRSVPCFDNGFGTGYVSSETRSMATVRGRLGVTFDRWYSERSLAENGEAHWINRSTKRGSNCMDSL